MPGDTKECPMCGETIKAAALKCRYCNSDLAIAAAAVEQDLFSGRPAAFYSAWQVFLLAGLALMAVLVGVGVASRSSGGEGAIAAFVSLVVAEGAAVLAFCAKTWGTHYRITTQRIKLERGVLSKVQESLELFRVDHFELRRPFGMRLLGQSALHVFSSDQELSNFYVYAIPDLAALAETLRECQLRERARRGLSTFLRA